MEQFIIDYRKKLERLEKEDGITRIPRLAVNPVDGSSYQKFVKTDKKYRQQAGKIHSRPETS